MRELKIYLAAPYQKKELMIARASELRACGIRVVSSWLDEPHKSTIQLSELSSKVHQGYAMQDVADVFAADVLVFQDDPTIVRSGRHVEMGIAIAIGQTRAMPIFVVGSDTANIFHYLPQVYHFDSWDETKARLLELARVSK